MDYNIIILLFIFLLVVLLLAFTFDVHGQLIEIYYNYKEKKNKYLHSNYYIVEFPSGEIIYLSDGKMLDYLLKIQIVSYVSKFKCFCYRDYDKKYIKRFIKCYNRERKFENYD